MVKLVVLIIMRIIISILSWLSIKANYPIIGIIFYIIGAVIMVAIMYIAVLMLFKNKRINRKLLLFVLCIMHFIVIVHYINLQYDMLWRVL